MSVLFTFPGQGAQQPGMLHVLPQHLEVTRTLDEAQHVLGTDPLQLDTTDSLKASQAVQLCLLIAGVAMARRLVASADAPEMVAGLSIGAYPAAVVAEVLEFRDALSLVALRGKLMDDAYPHGFGMAAITGLNQDCIETLVAQVHTPETPVYLANLNAERQFVISGADAALQAVLQRALSSGASKVNRLAVSVPSHCELYADAAAAMRTAFSRIQLHRPRLAYLSSSAARRLTDPAAIGEDLANNMARQVHWSETARLAWERGARLAVEMPSGSVLTNLISPLFSEGQAASCSNTSIETILTLISRNRTT